LTFVRVILGSRNHQSWESLVARLRPQTAAEGIARPTTIRLRELWATFQNAGVLVQIIEYAERNGGGTDTGFLAELRNDVLRIRFSALNTMLVHSHLERLR
jgi:hypothetical protein